MPSVRKLLLVVASIVGLAAAAPCEVDKPLAPSKDPWYTEPAGFESSPPGSVLRIRPAPGNLTSIVKGARSAWNVLYRTTNSHYKPTFAVTTVFVPEKKNKDTKALLSYQIPYDTADVDDSPSFAFYSSSPPADVKAAFEPLLALGYFVNVPDYEGPLASFTAGVISGHATLDSVRAVLSLHERLGLDAGARYALWGYSGGALASEWAAELQVQYAPEMEFAGAALGGLTPNVTSVLLTINGKASAGLAPSAMLGITSQYPGIRARVMKKLKKTGPHNATGFLGATKLSLDQSGVYFAYQDIGSYFVDGLADVLSPFVQQSTYHDGVMGYHGVPQMPLYVYKAIHDEISPIKDTDQLVDRFCGIGVNILYERNTVGGHSDDATNGGEAALEFLSAVLSGRYSKQYKTQGCTTRDVTVNVTDTGS